MQNAMINHEGSLNNDSKQHDVSDPPTPGSFDVADEKANTPSAWNRFGRNEVSTPVTGPTWHPTVLRVGALSGLCALLFSTLQIFAAYAILSASHGVAVDHWRLSPTVFLATLTAISNKALAFAAVQATVVTFWVRALQGTTLGQLHRDWAYGSCGALVSRS